MSHHCRLRNVRRVPRDLVVTPHQVHFREQTLPCQVHREVLNMGDWVVVGCGLYVVLNVFSRCSQEGGPSQTWQFPGKPLVLVAIREFGELASPSYILSFQTQVKEEKVDALTRRPQKICAEEGKGDIGCDKVPR